ncbi:HD-GYP domain-containing protein [Salidesulfovibrio onnuriiensis]|uniref:HD-GYP domain-containing protein n=1 Tax=Salidesulfovibrio onnuriiensis TaxID=2583823 RepID=UPI0011CADD12|nr:HD domain-containing phosphohydrolase [Salidesulfovibrio onnuriiensis]
MSTSMKHDISDGLNEEYYQINPDILGSFNKFRPPLNIYRFDEDVARIIPYYKVGGRLSSEQIEELAELTKEGDIFVSRDDHPVYVKHISYQLDLVLVDKNLKEREIADIFTQALTRRCKEFFEQPVPVVFEAFWTDLMVLTEYLFQDIHRSCALARRLTKEHGLEHHAVNSGFIGLALFGQLRENDFKEGGVKRQMFDRLAAGLFLHDLGMTKLPGFIMQKDKPLTTDERQKVNQHPNLGYQMLAKLDLKYPEVEQCVLEHHERVTGSGYPQKISGQTLSFNGRLCALADSFCAMVGKRPYKQNMTPDEAANKLLSDKAYDQQMTGVLRKMVTLLKLK